MIIGESQEQMSKEGVWISIGGILAESGGQGAGGKKLFALCSLPCAPCSALLFVHMILNGLQHLLLEVWGDRHGRAVFHTEPAAILLHEPVDMFKVDQV